MSNDFTGTRINNAADKSFRLECLRLAVASEPSESAGAVVTRAADYARFVLADWLNEPSADPS